MPKNFKLGFNARPCIRLSRVEEILKDTQIITPVPSRQTLINLILSGKLEGKKTDLGYIVYEDSLKDWIRSFQPEAFGEVQATPEKTSPPSSII
ncbi:MAG: hypothetical protein ICV60_05695 [Pyrinomonadaceae bacterium]|nr:hypothetical protein [Pyrinomonadaceae bacterium]